MPDPRLTDPALDALCARLWPIADVLALLALTLIAAAIAYHLALAALFERIPA
ncbi:hypothetical protein [Novosphingobium rosa]|uniref:hypothetical protein n=1 Tax=Novosphingobium rosa TaxID=76978 RepID=UPI000AF0F999|nr:hypothetical protein [Novosphingobium rosa]